MALVTVETPTRNRGLVSLASMKAHLGVTDAAQDALISGLIDEASAIVSDKLGRPLVRAKYRERFRGNERPTYRLHVAPVLEIHTASVRGVALDVAQFFIADSRSGLIHRDRSGFVQSETDVRWSQVDPHAWDILYTAGWLVPGDDVSADTAISFDSAQTVTRPAGWPLVVAGDWVSFTGAAESENNGVFQVLARTSDTVLTFEAGSGIVTEAAGESISASLSTLPGAIERAARELVAGQFYVIGSDRIVTSETVGPVSTSYAAVRSGGGSGVMEVVDDLLMPFRVPDGPSQVVRA